jgi:23S rRNA (cytosine1962-C5)-methyltransferase
MSKSKSKTPNNQYELLDSGDGKKLERFGKVTLSRPAAQALWKVQHPSRWDDATASFDRLTGLSWHGRERVPEKWVVPINGIKMKLSTTDFGHIGVFPETRALWDWIRKLTGNAVKKSNGKIKVLNLFAYSGGATLAAAQAGAQVCHLDASKGMVDWARENAALNDLTQAPIRWIVDDVHKFLAREIKRGNRYDAIMLDPPSFGRGKKGELYKIEKDLMLTLESCNAVLSDNPLFMILTSHTPGLSPIVLRNLLSQLIGDGNIESGEMLLTGGDDVFDLPNGNWARWTKNR